MLGFALLGLTDAIPATTPTQAEVKSAPAPLPEKVERVETKTISLRGRCIDHVDMSALAGTQVRLFKAQGRTTPIFELAKTISDQDGRFEFADLIPPRTDDPVDPLLYLVFAEADNRPIGAGGIWTGQEREKNNIEIRILREKTTLAGTVLSAGGVPVANARVAMWAVDGRPVPGILSATTGADGRFLINRIPHYAWIRKGARNPSGLSFTVSHPGHPQAELEVRELPRNVTVTLPVGCPVTGIVTDRITGRPAAGALVVAEQRGKFSETAASTNAAGRFQMVLSEDRFNFSVRAKDRVCIAITDRECLAGKTLELPPIESINGGFIAGQVLNTSTGRPITVSERGDPIVIGLIGPSQPSGNLRVATVDSVGRYAMRAAPGENFPYFVNLRGDRMSWNTTNQLPIVVEEGETTDYDMLVTATIPPEEKLKTARKLIASLPIKPSDRTARILVEFRKLNHTVDETELWCMLMRELVAIGRDAVPQLCDELDRTTEDRMLRRLGFALRAIDDPRAVPALIRAIPRTLVPASSDYGLIVADGVLADFMQQHDLRDGRKGGRYFDFGRPVREVFGALHKLTGQSFDDAELFGLHRSDDPRRQSQQRQLLSRQALRWQTWWQTHRGDFTDDPAYQAVNLKAEDEPLPPATARLGPKARLDESVHGATLSPAIQDGRYTAYFYDLDTGSQPKWPAQIPKVEARIDRKQLADWAAGNGVDLMCVTHRAQDGTQTLVLRSLGMKVWEISERDSRNIDKLVAAGTLPAGHDSGDLLMHYDEASKQAVPNANGAFIYITREGNMGLIEVTDRVIQTADLTGRIGLPPAGVGFHKGVRFNLKSIIP